MIELTVRWVIYEWQELRRLEALLEEQELNVLRLEALPRNLLSLEKARIVVQLKGLVQHWVWLTHDSRNEWDFVTVLERRRLSDLLQDLLRRIELIRTEPSRCKEFISCFLAMLLQMLLESLIFSGNLSEFPNRHRPPCTTMPWNIWPALVVLWGVCWMFNPWDRIDDDQLQPLSAGDQTWFRDSDIDNELTGYYQSQHQVSSNDPNWDSLGGDFPSCDLPEWHFSGHPEYGNLQRLHPESFAFSPAPDTQLVSATEAAPFPSIPAAPDPFSFAGQQLNRFQAAGQCVKPELIHSSKAPSGITAGQLATSFPGNTIGTSQGAGLALPIDQGNAIIAEGDQHERHAQLPASSARVGSASWIEQTANLPHKSTTYKRSEGPPQNAEGKMICKHVECSNLTFPRRCDWNKHMDKHERPYLCIVDGCGHLQGFTSKGDLSRHQRIVHKLDSEQDVLLFCDEPNCPRGPSGGPDVAFSRSDNLAAHIRRRHGQSSTVLSGIPRKVEITNGTIPPDVRLESPRPMDQEPAISLPRKRRRISELGLGSQTADRGDGEKEILYLRRELEEVSKRDEELTKELKEVRKKCEEKTQTLVGIIEWLTQHPK